MASADRTASANPAAPTPAATTSSATRSSRTISCAVAPARSPSSAGEVTGSGVKPVSTHSTDSPAAQEPLAHLGGAEFGPPGHVVANFGVRRQVEDGRAEPPEHEPGLRVEHRTARPARTLVQHRLERGLVRVPAQHPVAVVVDQGLFGDAGQQVRH